MIPKEVTLPLTSRHGFVAPHDHVLISCDFSSQETLVAAALSCDPVMTNSFNAPLWIQPNGQTTNTADDTTKENPDRDLHTLSTRAFCFPQLFENQPKTEWTSIARNEELIRLPGKPRDYGKRVNYFIQYLGSAVSLAELCHVEKKTAEEWIKGHESLYREFHKWARRMAAVGSARGWIETPWGKRVRWVDEENAKAAGESPDRASVNHLIQGLCADMGKAALIAIVRAFENTPVQVANFVHDEIILVAPGKAILKEAKEKKGVWHLKYEPDDQALATALRVKRIMETIETRMINEYLPGLASFEVAPFWSH